MDHNQERRRGHFRRGRREPDHRGPDRRPQSQAPERPGRDHVDVEQIMREIRARVAQRQGVDLTGEQIQDLAARRLESLLDPRAIKSSLIDELRRTAGAVAPTVAPKASTEPVYSFEDTTIYDSHRGTLRLIRRLLNPLLKLFFNPEPLIQALHLQARLNVDASAREAERDRRQAEWNALHYEILQRLVGEISRSSLEIQALSLRVEALHGRVDFNDRHVRSLEGTAQQARPATRQADAAPAPRPADTGGAPVEAVADTPQMEGARRRRRRRRGRRGGALPGEAGPPPAVSPSPGIQMPQAPAGQAGVQQDLALMDAGVGPVVTERAVSAEPEHHENETAALSSPEPPQEAQSAPPAPAPHADPPATDPPEQ